MASIRQAEMDRDRTLIRELLQEYLGWMNTRFSEEYGFTFDVASTATENMASLASYSPPDGHLLLASEDGRAAGMAWLHKIGDGMGEIKRMYVRPEFRRRGIGASLLEGLIAQAREMGYAAIRLDCPLFLTPAHALYRSAGFYDIEPYAESEIPPEFHQYWLFMEKRL